MTNGSSSKFITSLKEFLPQMRDIFGLKIFASSTVPVKKLNHAATILHEYLDNNEDGIVDNPLVHEALLSLNGGMIMHQTSDEFDKMEPKYRHITEKFTFNYSKLWNGETRPSSQRRDPTSARTLRRSRRAGDVPAVP